MADVQQLAAGKDVLLDELAHAGAELAGVDAAGRDAVVHHQAAGLEQAEDLAEVGGHVDLPHMLEHAHRGDLVEALRLVQFAVVAQFHAHPALQALFLDQPLNMRMLVLRQRDAGGVDAVVLRRPHQQAAPAGADVQELLAGLEHQLAADVVELGFLRLRQRHRRCRGSRRRNRRGADPATAHRNRRTRRSGTGSAARPSAAYATPATWPGAASASTSSCRCSPACPAAGRAATAIRSRIRPSSCTRLSTKSSASRPIWPAAIVARLDQSLNDSVTAAAGGPTRSPGGQPQRHRHRQAGQLRLDLAHKCVHLQILVKLSGQSTVAVGRFRFPSPIGPRQLPGNRC